MQGFGSASLEGILSALIEESVRARLRHRALLAVLSDTQRLAYSEYVEAYQQAEERDFGVLLDMLMLPHDEFMRRHGEWANAEAARFGFVPNVAQGVLLTTGTARPDAATPRSRKRAASTAKKESKRSGAGRRKKKAR